MPAMSPLLLALLLHLAKSAGASYNLLLNNSAGNYHYNKNLTDGSGVVIGGLYQDSVFDPAGNFLGINQGYAFNFDNGTSFNYNNVLFLGEGQEIYWMDYAIIRATGTYRRYDGGMLEMNVIQPDPNFVAEITLYEPSAPTPQQEAENDNSSSDSIMFQITSEGGYFVPITSNGEQIGQQFQNPITMPGSSNPDAVVGVNQGYSFLFPQDSFITDVLGYSSPEQVLGNRHFILDGKDAGEMVVLNEQVLHATESLRKYTGATLDEEILSTDPLYVANITLKVPPAPGDSEGENFVSEGSYDLRITSSGGFSEAIVEKDGSWIGERFQNPVYNSANVRIGTNEGYYFTFPATNSTPSLFHQSLGNRKFYFEGGTLDVLNEAIVAADGIYAKYSGGTFNKNIVSYYDPFVSEIILLGPGGTQLEEEIEVGAEFEAEEVLGSTSGVFSHSISLEVAGSVLFVWIRFLYYSLLCC